MVPDRLVPYLLLVNDLPAHAPFGHRAPEAQNSRKDTGLQNVNADLVLRAQSNGHRHSEIRLHVRREWLIGREQRQIHRDHDPADKMNAEHAISKGSKPSGAPPPRCRHSSP